MSHTSTRKRRFRLPAHGLFSLGQVVATPNALRSLNPAEITDGLRRHANGDWGDLCPEDAESNIESLHGGGRIFSAYGKGKKRFWIISECGSPATTILMPEDY